MHEMNFITGDKVKLSLSKRPEGLPVLLFFGEIDKVYPNVVKARLQGEDESMVIILWGKKGNPEGEKKCQGKHCLTCLERFFCE